MSSEHPIPLARPDVGEGEESAVLEALRSGRLSMGPAVERFEQDFASWLGASEAVAVSSGTAALHLGVRALGWRRGDEVLTSPFSFVASANCLLYEDARPVFCDVDPVTLNLDPQLARDTVGEGTAGVLPVHIFGYPAATAALDQLARDRGLGVLEDACEALGAVDAEGLRVGARGNLATFGFYPNKQLTTGEGGVLVAPDPALAERARSERNQGRGEDMGWVDHVRLGFNYRLSDLQAALGAAQLKRLDELLAARERAAGLYREHLAALGAAPAGDDATDPDGLVLPCADRGAERRSWFVYVVQLPIGVDREDVIATLRQRGVASKAYLPCIHLLPFYRERFGYRGGECPVAESISARSLALPFFTDLGEGEVERVVGALAEALGR